MKILSAAVVPVRIPLRTPLVMAHATRTHARSVLVRLDGDAGRTGWGEAAPVPEVTAERRANVREALERVCAERLVGAEIADPEPLRAVLRRDLARLPSARGAVDAAVADLKAQAAGLPLDRWLGGARSAVPACATIGVLPTGETAARAKALVAEGFPVLKLKVARAPRDEADRILRVREAVGPAPVLIVDANQAWKPAGAIAFARAVRAANLALIEQPVAAGDLAGLAETARESPVPVFADEAVTDHASLIRLIEAKAAKGVNVKVHKCGGPTEAAAMLRTAEAAGLMGMVGCMIETRVGISAALAVALGCANVAHADLDGSDGLAEDPVVAGGARRVGGARSLPRLPGLSLTLDADRLAALRDDDPDAP